MLCTFIPKTRKIKYLLHNNKHAYLVNSCSTNLIIQLLKTQGLLYSPPLLSPQLCILTVYGRLFVLLATIATDSEIYRM